MKFSIRHSMKWSIFIFAVTFVLASAISVASTAVMAGVSWAVGLFVVFLIISVGIFFDVMGLASASAQEKPFHAMASEKLKGARHAIYVVRNADRFSNFCNDVIGDICGIVSGTASALVVIKLIGSEDGFWANALGVLVAGLVSATTVGGKALGKSFAMNYATDIVLMIGRAFYFLEHRFGIRIVQSKKKKSSVGKRGKQRAARTHSGSQ